MRIPDYSGGSIVNLVSSIRQGCGGESTLYPELRDFTSERIAAAQNVVLLVLDGLGYDYLTTQGAGSQLQQQLHCGLDSVAPPTTAASITTFLTGVAPQQHGLTGWFTWLREVGAVVTVLPFAIRGNRSELNSHGITPQQLFNHSPLFDQLNVAGYSLMPEQLGESVFSQAMLGKGELVLYRGMDDYFAKITEVVQRGKHAKYLYAYWPQFDSLAHQYGLKSKQLARQFAQLDRGFVRLQQQLAGSNTLLLVTADHGFIDTTAESRLQINDYPEILACLQIPLCGEPRLPYCYVRSSQRARFVELVTQQLGHALVIHQGETVIAEGLFGLGKAHPELNSRVGEFVLEMKDNYTLTQRLLGEAEYHMVGQHGGLSEAEIRVPLVVAHC